MKYNKIFLVGFMGCGKSTFGRKLAAQFKWDFIDMDDYIEEKFKKSISAIFNEEGEARFREIESEVIVELASLKKVVVSTGGGTPCFNNNDELLNEFGLSVYIALPPETLFDRLKGEKAKRPLIANLSDNEMLTFIQSKLKEREASYLSSTIVYNYNQITESEFFNSLVDQLEM